MTSLNFTGNPGASVGDTAALPSPDTQLLQMLLDNVPARAVVVGLDFCYIYANHEFVEFMGLRQDQVIGHSVAELVGQAAFEAYLPVLHRLDAGESLRWESWIDYPGHGRRYVQEHLMPYAPQGGPVLAYVAFGRDLTNLKLREIELAERVAQLQTTEALKSAIVDNAFAALISADAQGAIVEFNPAAEAMFGCSRAQALGQSVEDIMIPPEHRHAHRAGMDRMRQGHAPRVLGKRMELMAQRPDGSRFPVEMVLWQTNLAGHPHYTASLIDLSERKRAAEVIERQRDALRHAERMGAMGSMLAGVAHELNNPLAIVMGRATLLEEKAAGTELADDSRRIREAAERCGRIVRTFLDMARSRPSERKPVVLNELVQGGVELLRYGLRTHGVHLRLALAADMPTPMANADQVGQIVLNLIINAQQALADYPPPREIEISTGVEALRNSRSQRVWLRVQDNGPGIPEDRSDAVFEPFFTTKPEGQGLGLGLALCRSIAREHGGELQLEAGHGGASFRLSLPIADADSEAEAHETLSTEAGTSVTRLLLVDDEAEIADLQRQFLESEGYEVVVAESGAIALEMLAEARFDAVISDLRMPDIDGAALWRALGERWPQLRPRLLFVTGDSLSTGAAEFFAQAGCPSLLKPFTKGELLAAVRRLLSDARGLLPPTPN